MNIFIRVDASIEIGTGHVMRCLTLAKEFKNLGHRVAFISRELDGHMCNFIKTQGYTVYMLSKIRLVKNNCNTAHAQWLQTSWEIDAQQTIEIMRKSTHFVDWLIVDHYALDKKWEKKLKKFTRYIMVIDDLADRLHMCDVLLDQNYYTNINHRYKKLLPKNCIRLLGPKYALLRAEFLKVRKNLRKRTSNLKTVLIFFGGSDPTNETSKVIKALEAIDCKQFLIDIVIGRSNPQKDVIQHLCRKHPNMTFHYNIDYMSRLMNEADLAICAGGSTTWERYCLGLPALLISVAYNQIEICKAVGNLGIDFYIGKSEEIYEKDIINAIEAVKSENFDLEESSKKALEIVDGFGKIRVVSEILQY
ncbi:UDP-2,4-diacetamido-2,4,6-trideoxy-beta-L-altropyranose hydrolase [Bacillus pseudomycoides]|uniref:UDP-2,4-diacetamido-2,4, 6-trideoxy-beta-L-altropyranose hydrolase n=1 Tax=Bacillus pseudomycoides TaxID=64104 RepID=A0AA91VBL8_9BACI|nr:MULTISPECIES: UDP-2,4-diacetamido-2,4,6-trideoxy-beta-L-altropyranose hydrolase [Bacillus]PEB51542.1 UDP-2,4-diacetamido-2,4,6-trideoxy-beta-L-altropyranose hydrolase [Bacillus sp. AFS098217]PED82011.1 UDP-2,4-diacetamido-2,4,6-trideoxy-beta-L-altropyranose hydrolase [Bacillus pseudomycoides]PEU16885.1 UDP-2,4-diacetamido-2,4,6-trideoxy-beta-L-altropyranose hydrolase [Bacillus sp. AFS019443]PEU20290.1 UDP-2,4-diacetamido-2,4,6-trideoxy-beta-L-altropyranose hydrolase [Bacillus sp. AFS014408]